MLNLITVAVKSIKPKKAGNIIMASVIPTIENKQTKIRSKNR